MARWAKVISALAGLFLLIIFIILFTPEKIERHEGDIKSIKTKPITKEEVSDYENKVKQKKEEEKKRLKEEKRRLEEEIEENRKRLEEKRKQEELAMKKASIKRYINPIIYNDPLGLEISLLIVDKNTLASFQYSGTIEDESSLKLARENTKDTSYSGLFEVEFIKDGKFNSLYQGSIQDIFFLELKNHVDYLILGTQEAIFSKIPPLNYFTSCTLLFDLKIYSTQTGEIIAIDSFKEKGAGNDNWEAGQQAFEKIIDKAEIFIVNTVKGIQHES